MSFDTITKKMMSSVFIDTSVLVKGHHPETLSDVLHRDAKIDEYVNKLYYLVRNEVPDNLFVYGTYGTGKTMLSRLVTAEYKEYGEANGHPISVVYSFCENYPSSSKILRYINKELANSIPDVENKRVGTSISDNLAYFCELVNARDSPIVLIFDECDKLADPDILNPIARIKECGFTKNNVCIICVTNDSMFYNRLAGRTKSIIGRRDLYVPPYNASELFDILSARAKQAFREGACPPNVISLCAAYGAQENGDARKAMDLLLLAGTDVDERKGDIITEDDIKAMKVKVEVNQQLKLMMDLPDQTKCVLFAAIHMYEKVGKPIQTPVLYTMYQRMCKLIYLDILSQRRINDYVNELEDVGILSVKKSSRGKNRGVVNVITPAISSQALKDINIDGVTYNILKERILSSIPSFDSSPFDFQ